MVRQLHQRRDAVGVVVEENDSGRAILIILEKGPVDDLQAQFGGQRREILEVSRGRGIRLFQARAPARGLGSRRLARHGGICQV